jgi:hypothetical protein
VLLACRPRADAPKAAAASQKSPVPRMECLSPDSAPIAYGRIRVSNVTGDASGVQVAFQVKDDEFLGLVRDARGETPPQVPLQDLRYDSVGDTISFWYGDGGTRFVYKYHMTCEELSGLARLFVTDTDTGLVREQGMARAPRILSP